MQQPHAIPMPLDSPLLTAARPPMHPLPMYAPRRLCNGLQHEQASLLQRLRLRQHERLQAAISSVITDARAASSAASSSSSAAAAAAAATSSRPQPVLPVLQLVSLRDGLTHDAPGAVHRLRDALRSASIGRERTAGTGERTATDDVAYSPESRLRQLGWKRFKQAMADAAQVRELQGQSEAWI